MIVWDDAQHIDKGKDQGNGSESVDPFLHANDGRIGCVTMTYFRIADNTDTTSNFRKSVRESRVSSRTCFLRLPKNIASYSFECYFAVLP